MNFVFLLFAIISFIVKKSEIQSTLTAFIDCLFLYICSERKSIIFISNISNDLGEEKSLTSFTEKLPSFTLCRFIN